MHLIYCFLVSLVFFSRFSSDSHAKCFLDSVSFLYLRLYLLFRRFPLLRLIGFIVEVIRNIFLRRRPSSRSPRPRRHAIAHIFRSVQSASTNFIMSFNEFSFCSCFSHKCMSIKSFNSLIGIILCVCVRFFSLSSLRSLCRTSHIHSGASSRASFYTDAVSFWWALHSSIHDYVQKCKKYINTIIRWNFFSLISLSSAFFIRIPCLIYANTPAKAIGKLKKLWIYVEIFYVFLYFIRFVRSDSGAASLCWIESIFRMLTE